MEHNILPHIIHREVLELHLPRNRFDGHIEGRVKNALEVSRNRLEKVLDSYAQQDQLTIIDEIFVDLGSFHADELDLFGTRLCEALSNALKKNITHTEKQALAAMTTILTDREIAHVSQTSNQSSFAEITNHKMGTIEETRIEKALPKAFLYFLENGIFPWWLSDQIDSDVESIFSTVSDNMSTAQLTELKSLLKKNSNALHRLTHQFSPGFINKLVTPFKVTSRSEVVSIIEAIEKRVIHSKVYRRNVENFGSKLAVIFVKMLLSDDVNSTIDLTIGFLKQQIVDGHDTADAIEELLREKCFAPFAEEIRKSINEIVPAKHEIQTAESTQIIVNKKILSKADDARKIDPDLDHAEKFIYVHHAGLVILHPFLSHFFSILGLLSESKQFVDEFAQTKALHLLGFLCSGKVDLAEPALSICKFLCGMPLKKAISRNISLSDHEINECNELLTAVIGHWSALKNTSADGLREAFLSRKGKLDWREDTTILYVESKPIDVLLESLPWGLSYIHLPWLKSPFSIIWN